MGGLIKPRVEPMKTLQSCLVAVAMAILVGCSASSPEQPWPRDVVKIEQMRLLKPLNVGVPRLIRKGEVKGPAVLRAHIGSDGSVQRVVLQDSSGSPDHDEAALHAMRSARFQPPTFGGAPIDVTLVVPLYFPYRSSLK